MRQRVRAERREHAHVLLRVVQGMKPPQGCRAVIRHVCGPIHGVDPHQDQRHRHHLGHQRQAPQHQEMGVTRDHDRETGVQQRDERPHERVQPEVARIHQMSPGQRPPRHGGPETLDQKHHDDHADQSRRDHLPLGSQHGMGQVMGVKQVKEPDHHQPAGPPSENHRQDPHTDGACSSGASKCRFLRRKPRTAGRGCRPR